VIIGNSGVWKTSLRGQARTIHQLLVCPRLTLRIITAIKYVSGQFSTAYCSTIGTNFITKTLPRHSKPDESATTDLGPSLSLRLYPHRSHDHRIPPDKNAFHPSLLHCFVERMSSSSSRRQSARDAARSQPLVVGVLRVQTSFSAMRKWEITVLS
jgi:hypothetical protein